MARRKMKDSIWAICYDVEVAYKGQRATEFLDGWDCLVLSTNDLEDAFMKVKKREMGRVFEGDEENEVPEGVVVGVRFTSATIKDTLTFL